MSSESQTPPAPQANLSVVISGLPNFVSLTQIARFAGKAGAVATHPETGEPLVLHNPRTHKATVTYSYPEAANQAIALLTGSEFARGHRVTVDRAPKEPFDFSVWRGAFRQQRKFHSYLGTHSEDLTNSEQKRLKIMVLRKVFEPTEFIKNPALYGTLVKDWTEECGRFGKVTLVKPIEAHPEGVVIVRFDTPQAAACAIGELDGADYRGREVTTEPWDGSDLSVREAPEDEERRIIRYERFLDGGVDSERGQP
jgi:hypothetical protein